MPGRILENPQNCSLRSMYVFGLLVLISISNISCNNNENSGRSFLWNIYMTFAHWFVYISHFVLTASTGGETNVLNGWSNALKPRELTSPHDTGKKWWILDSSPDRLALSPSPRPSCPVELKGPKGFPKLHCRTSTKRITGKLPAGLLEEGRGWRVTSNARSLCMLNPLKGNPRTQRLTFS